MRRWLAARAVSLVARAGGAGSANTHLLAHKDAMMNEPRKHQKYEALIARCRDLLPVVVAVVHPCDEVSLRSAVDAARAGLITPVLVGPAARIDALAASLGIDISGYAREAVPHSHAAAARAVELVRSFVAHRLPEPGGGFDIVDWLAILLGEDVATAVGLAAQASLPPKRDKTSTTASTLVVSMA